MERNIPQLSLWLLLLFSFRPSVQSQREPTALGFLLMMYETVPALPCPSCGPTAVWRGLFHHSLNKAYSPDIHQKVDTCFFIDCKLDWGPFFKTTRYYKNLQHTAHISQCSLRQGCFAWWSHALTTSRSFVMWVVFRWISAFIFLLSPPSLLLKSLSLSLSLSYKALSTSGSHQPSLSFSILPDLPVSLFSLRPDSLLGPQCTNRELENKL